MKADELFREVDEELQREKMQALWKRYGGYVVALAVSLYAHAAARFSSGEIQSAAVLTLALVAAWILVVASRPLTRSKSLILAGMYAGLGLLFTVPAVKEFFRLEWPPPDLLAATGLVAVAGGAAIEAAARFQRRLAAAPANAR